MTIKWLGHSSFYIQSSNVSIITDPFNPNIGLKFPKISADIITVSHDHYDHSYTVGVEGNPVIINNLGKHTINNIEITGIQSYHDDQNGATRGQNIIFKFTIENMTLVHFGDIGHILNQKTIDQLSSVDIIMLPVGGTFTIDPIKALEIFHQLNPKFILPMHYQIEGLVVSSRLLSVEDFINRSGLDYEKVTELNISKEKLPTNPKIIIFNLSK